MTALAFGAPSGSSDAAITLGAKPTMFIMIYANGTESTESPLHLLSCLDFNLYD